jgi:aarF domain-containing kinase
LCNIIVTIMSSSWIKVAAGARLVASAVAKQTAEEAAVAAQRVTHHGLDLSSKARQTSQEVFRHSMNVNEYVNRPSTNGGAGYESASSSSAGTSPYESQLRKKQQQQEATVNGTAASNLNGEPKPLNGQANTPIPIPNPYLLHAEQPETMISKEQQFAPEELGIKHHEQPNADDATTTPLERSMASSGTQIRAPSTDDDSALPRLQEGRSVPSSRVARAVGFASLGAGLAWGTASEFASRLVRGGGSSSSAGSVVTSDANADRLAATLCRMRGAALKMGQMLSIQDESLLPPALTRALNQVRQGADAMPRYQLVQQLEAQLGANWRDNFESFDEQPFAAASIGQVHKATIRHDEDGGKLHHVVVKVQYPGVAASIESDLRNLSMLVTFTGLAPKGLFIENVLRVGRDELQVECNYLNEMANQQAFQELVTNDPILRDNGFVIPNVIEALTTEQVITSDYASGGTIDRVSHLDQEERNRIGRTILYLTMKELFVWRLMQTDPNWGNFLYDVATRQTTLIDFGATREFSKDFVDGYLRIVWASANRDEKTLMAQSHRMGFLTGDENEQMLHAHKLSGFTVGEPFWTNDAFDFQGSSISTRLGEHTSVFLKHRLTPPPEEVYTLHRKLAGAYMLCIKLGANISSRDMLEDIVRNHKFEDGLPHPMPS